MKEYLSIKEFSKLSGIEQTTLRYWDDIGLFSPAKRNPENNYRYYSPEQIITVNFVTVLSELNIPLKTIGEMESGRTPERIVGLIEQQEKQLDVEMRRLRDCFSIIHTRRELINYGTRLKEGFRVVDGIRVDRNSTSDKGTWVNSKSVAVLRRDGRSYILGPRNEWKTGEPFYEYFMKFCDAAEDMRINLSFPIGGYHESMSSFLEAPGEPDYFISLDPAGNRKFEAGKYLIGFYHGYYGMFGDLPERMAAYAKDHSLNLVGPVYTVYLLDEVCMPESSQYLAQISVAIS